MMRRFAASGAKAPRGRKHLFAALKRCATQKLNRAGTSAFFIFSAAALCCAQTQIPAATPSAASGPKADTVYVHANVYTGVRSNAQFSSILREEAIAVRGDRIQAVGKNGDIEKLKGPQTQVIDLCGHFVMPGFNDAHLHLADAG
ncbi:MAG: hypothetical protein WAN41_07705, partial [Candidatus Sulfotelmatobacter sp.]